MLQHRQVALGIPGVVLEVLAGTELGGVDEYADNHGPALGAGLSHQGEVAFVKVAHCRHEADRLS